MGQGRLKGPQSMEVHTKLGVLQHPHSTSEPRTQPKPIHERSRQAGSQGEL